MTYSPNNPVSDAARPHTGALITAQEIRDLINSATAFNSAAAAAPERGYTVLIGDVGFNELAVTGSVVFTVTNLEGTATQVTASLDTSSGNLGYAQVAADMQTAFSAAGITGGTVTVSSITEEVGGRLVITADKGLTLRVDSTTNGVESLILGVQGRYSALPYTVPKLDPLHATPFVNEDTGESTLYVNSPARVTGPAVSASGPYSGNLRIRVDVDGTASTQDVAINALTLDGIATAINSAFTTFFAGLDGDAYDSYPLAKVVNSTYLSLSIDGKTGTGNDTYSYATTTIGISGRDADGLIADDLAETLLGLPARRGSSSEHVFTNDRKIAFFRGVPVVGDDNTAILDAPARGTMGVGTYGPAVESKEQLPATPLDTDLEIRFVADKKVPWAYDSNLAAWTRAVPATVAPISYALDEEAYKLDNTGDTFTPDYLGATSATATASNTFALNSTVTSGGLVGEVPRLVDVRNSQSEMSFANNSTGSRSLFREMPLFNSTTNRAFQKGTRQGVPFLGSVTDFEGMTSTSGVAAEGFVWAGAVGTVLERPSTTSGSLVGFELQGTESIAEGKLFRIVASTKNYNADREALTRDWQKQILQIPAPASGGTAAGSAIYHVEQEDLSGALGPRWLNTSTIDSIAQDDYQLTLRFQTAAGNHNRPSEGQFVQVVAVVPETGGRPDVTAVLRTQGEAQDATTKAGVIFSTVATLPTAFDSGTNTGIPATYEYYRATVSVGGILAIDHVTNATTTNLATFKVDQGLDATPRTLRVVVEEDDANNEFVRVYWGGTEDFANSLVEERDHTGALTTAFASDNYATRWLQQFPRGGQEADARTPALAGHYQIKDAGAVGSHYDRIIGTNDLHDAENLACLPGLYADPNGTDDGDHIIFDQFISVGFSKFQTEAANPGLPPVSAAMVRDSINAVTVSLNGNRQGIGSGNHAYQITDCTTNEPLVINLQGDLADNTLGYNQGVVIDTTNYEQDPGRTINIGYEHNEAVAHKQTQYWPQSSYNVSGGTSHPESNVSPSAVPATANSKSSKTTWDLGDHVNDARYGYNGSNWTNTGTRFTVFSSQVNRPGAFTSSRTFSLGRACDVATLSAGYHTNYEDRYGTSDLYANVDSYNRLAEAPSGYWAPFGAASASNPAALRLDNIVYPRYNTNNDAYGYTGTSPSGRIIPTCDATTTTDGSVPHPCDNNGWWLSVPAITDVGDEYHDAVLPCAASDPVLSVAPTGSPTSLGGEAYLHSAADPQRRYCTPAWTSARQSVTYSFLTTMPSIAQHQAAYGGGTTLRYEVDTCEIDYHMSTWLGQSNLCMTNQGGATNDPDSSAFLPAQNDSGGAVLPSGFRFLQSNHNNSSTGAIPGFVSEYIYNTSTGALDTVARFDPSGQNGLASAYRLTPERIVRKNQGFYDPFVSMQVKPNDSNRPVTAFSGSTFGGAGNNENPLYWKDHWFQGRPIFFPRVTDVAFHQPNSGQSIVTSANPFVTVSVTIAWWGPVVPAGIRLRTSATATPA